MTNRETMELFIEKNGQETVAYPFVEKDHVVFGNGMGIEEVIEQDISMPTVTHEEVSFKVGVGDQDVSSAIVDSSVSEMTIKGKTYQNILPEPSTHVLTNNKEMFKVNEGLDPNVEIVDGVSKSAILSGNTLVNLIPEGRQSSFHLNNTHGGGYAFWDSSNVNMIKPSTKYLILTNVTLNTGSRIVINNNEGYISCFADGIYYEPNEVGIKKTILTSKSDLSDCTTILRSYTHTVGEVKGTIQVFEYQQGMENWNIPYFTGMQSVKMPVLTTTGKNLFDGKIELGSLSVNTGEPTSATTEIRSKNFTPINGTPFVISRTDSSGSLALRYYDINKNYLGAGDGGIAGGATTKLFTPPTNARYVKFKAITTNLSQQIQIEYNTTATTYEPYKSNILTVNEDVTLRGIGDVQDTLDCLTGELTERIGEIMLDGSEAWTYGHGNSTETIALFYANLDHNGEYKPSINDKLPSIGGYSVNFGEGIYVDSDINIRIKRNKLNGSTVDNFKQWLSNNPITLQYKLNQSNIKTVDLSIIDQDGNTPEGLHFFKDGHIQLSSGADNSLIPTLDYQAKTSNSYVMDLMKANTRYTMKAKSASGTFTIDGTSYGAGTNGTFTTPSSMTNKLLVMSNKTNEEVMILEGDVTSKTIPYFKGIKSTFEGEDKIEVLSTGKNLFDINYFYKEFSKLTGRQVRLAKDSIIMEGVSNDKKHDRVIGNIKLKPNTAYKMSCNIKTTGDSPFATYEVYYNDALNGSVYLSQNSQNGEFRRFTTESSGIIQVRLDCPSSNNVTEYSNIYIVEDDGGYEPYKSNNTKIPLLSPLRSLPNGVCDELIIDRMKKKATLIQRVGHSVINSEFAKNGGKWGNTKDTNPCWGFHCGNYVQGSFKLNEHNSINDKLPIKGMATTGDPLMGYYQSNPHIALRREEVCDMKMALNWLDRNPINFYYQLETPVITEVDLEGFPYIYKDGHIFLNSEIAPTTQITYSISQQHQISASTQDLIRHEQELVYLYKLIAQYIQVDYQSTLLSLDLKLK